MKLNKYIPVAALSLMLLNSGCSDSFLEKSPSDYITSGDLEEVAKWNTNILMGQALGTYSTTFAMSTGGVGGHDDFGQKAVDIATDLMSGDIFISRFFLFRQLADLISNLISITKNFVYFITTTIGFISRTI